MTVYDLPPVNATINAITTVLLVTGWLFIRAERKRAHIICMVSALVTSAAFLACYLTYHAYAGSIKFTAQGWVRPVYFTILLTHTVLAMVVLPLVIATVIPAIRARWDRHRAVARWTLPVWLYVSVTGVLVYMMLYQWWPSAELVGRR